MLVFDQPESRCQEVSQAPPCMWRDPSSLNFFYCISQAISRELNQQQSSWDMNHKCGIPGDTTCKGAKSPLPMCSTGWRYSLLLNIFSKYQSMKNYHCSTQSSLQSLLEWKYFFCLYETLQFILQYIYLLPNFIIDNEYCHFHFVHFPWKTHQPLSQVCQIHFKFSTPPWQNC